MGGTSLGPTLRALRLAAGMTQEELAEAAGVSARTVSDVERGLRMGVHGYTADRLASALALDGDARRAFDALARGRPWPPSPQPARAGRLPWTPTRLLGRERELESVRGMLDRGVRLLTLTGAGGIGKTRLAAEAGRRAAASFGGGVFFVSLSELRDASLVAPQLATAIGVVEAGANLRELIAARLDDCHALIILDTFEHLIPAAPLVYELLRACPHVAFIVTSRIALRVRGEQELPVRQLEVAPAAALFWERVRAVRPDFVSDRDAAALALDICRELDCLPLGIELAAARLKHLPLSAVRDQLGHRLGLLVGGPLDGPPRQRTMRDAIAWSHDLLGTREATLFRRLAVFSGGWPLDTVQDVCGPPGEIGDALDGISALVDHSLVVLGPGTGGRYGMLDVVREYAELRLYAAGEAEEVGRRHARRYLGLAEEAEPHLMRSGHDNWFKRLAAERGNFRRALAWHIDRGEAVPALRFTAALWRLWRHLGELAEGRRWADAALRVPGEAPVSLRARAVMAAAALAFPQGDHRRMSELIPDATELARRSGEPMDLRNALTLTGMVAQGEGRYGDALRHFGEALAICQTLGLSWHLATSHLNFGAALLHLDRPGEADAVFEEGLRAYRELGDDVFAARATNQRAQAALARDDLTSADVLARAALAEFAAHAEPQGIAEALQTLAALGAARADPDRAAMLAGAASAITETIASRPIPDLVVAVRLLTAAERSVPGSRWRAAWARGRSVGTDAAIAFALGERNADQ